METMTPYFRELERAVCAADHLLLLTDQRPDGDTFGSSLAFAEYARRLKKRVTHFATTPPLSGFAFLYGIETCTSDAAALDDASFDLAVVFDSSREDVIRPLVRYGVPLVVVDHHASNTRFGELNVVDTTATSTCEVVYAYLRHVGAVVSPEMAKCLVTGIVTDTGAFAHLGSGSVREQMRAFEAVERLLLQGGSVQRVVQEILRATSVPRLQLWGRIFSRLRYIPHLHMAVTAVLLADFETLGVSHEDVSEVSDYLGTTLNVDVTLFLKEQEDGIKVSARSHETNLLPFVQAFGGGGHAHACGFFLPGARLAERGGQLVVE